MPDLTEEQQAIVARDHGAALVFTVAGSGRTTAKVHRVERLVRERVFGPRSILATSFSRAAGPSPGGPSARPGTRKSRWRPGPLRRRRARPPGGLRRGHGGGGLRPASNPTVEVAWDAGQRTRLIARVSGLPPA